LFIFKKISSQRGLERDLQIESGLFRNGITTSNESNNTSKLQNRPMTFKEDRIISLRYISTKNV